MLSNSLVRHGFEPVTVPAVEVARILITVQRRRSPACAGLTDGRRWSP